MPTLRGGGDYRLTLVFGAGHQLVVEVRAGNQRAGFRHAIRGGQLNAFGFGGHNATLVIGRFEE